MRPGLSLRGPMKVLLIYRACDVKRDPDRILFQVFLPALEKQAWTVVPLSSWVALPPTPMKSLHAASFAFFFDVRVVFLVISKGVSE